MANFASGRYSQALCARCAWAFPYLELKREPNGSWVCGSCWDVPFDIVNHPQNFPPPVSPDPVALEHPRPDVALATVGAVWSIGTSITFPNF